MVEESNSKEVAGLAQSFGQDAIFGTGRDVPGRMIMGTEPGTGIHEDQWFEDFAGMDNRQVQRARRDDIDSDELVFCIQTTDEELLSVQTVKQWPENGRRTLRGMPYFRTGLSGPTPFEEPRELSTDMSASF